MYQLLKAKVTGKNIGEAEPKDYVNFDLKGGLSIYEFMQSLAKKAEDRQKTQETKGQPLGEQKIAKQEQLLSFENEDISLCPEGRGHAIHNDVLKESNRVCPRHGVKLSDNNLGRREGSLRRSSFLKKNDEGNLIWVIEAPPPFETDVYTKSGTYRALIKPPKATAPSGK